MRRSAASGNAGSKVFVLDTSVILYDSNAINNFEEHDVAIPITVLEELDQFKKGNNVINLHAREFMRHLDRLSEHADLTGWVPLNGASRGRFRVLAEPGATPELTGSLAGRKNDHRILGAAIELARSEKGRPVILITKDINLRVKARAVSLPAEDYESVKVPDVDHLYRGTSELMVGDDAVLDRLYHEGSVAVSEVLSGAALANHYYILRGPSKSALAVHRPRQETLERIHKGHAYGVVPRNAEQTMATKAASLTNRCTPASTAS